MTEAEELRISLAISARELAAMAETLRQAEEDRDSAHRQLAHAQYHIAALSQRVRFVLRSRSHVKRLRAHIDQLADMLADTTPFADHTGEIR
jgi:hypothetical protein